MRYCDLYESSSFLVLASTIWEFANNYTDEEKAYLRIKSKEEPESWEGYLWRMIPSIKYNKVWSGYRDLADSMKKNSSNHDKYFQIKKYLGKVR